MDISWSPSAEDCFLNTLENLMGSSSSRANKLYNQVTLLQELLKTNKHLCPRTKHSVFRKCTILKQYGLIYTIQQDKIEILAFFPNNSNHQFYNKF